MTDVPDDPSNPNPKHRWYQHRMITLLVAGVNTANISRPGFSALSVLDRPERTAFE